MTVPLLDETKVHDARKHAIKMNTEHGNVFDLGLRVLGGNNHSTCIRPSPRENPLQAGLSLSFTVQLPLTTGFVFNFTSLMGLGVVPSEQKLFRKARPSKKPATYCETEP